MAIFKKKNGQLVDFSNPIPDTSIAPIENGATSTHNYVVGAYALVKGILKKVTNAISIGTAFSDSNSETTDVATELKELNDDVTTINTQLSKFDGYNSIGITSSTTYVPLTVDISAYKYFVLCVSRYNAQSNLDSIYATTVIPSGLLLNSVVDITYYARYVTDSNTTLTATMQRVDSNHVNIKTSNASYHALLIAV